MARPVFPYGDGRAAQRIVAAVRERLVARNAAPLRAAG
jgi:UDP-N-acetylglucosamine 2-epimerase